MAKATFNNATISKAEVGVTNYDRQLDFQGNSTGGGIIQAKSSNFLDNGYGVHMQHYQNYDNVLPAIKLDDYSSFKECSFVRSNAYLNYFSGTSILMRLHKVYGVYVQACVFNCSASSGKYLNTYGIYLESAGATITEKCTPSPWQTLGSPCSGGTATSFDNLYSAVYATAPFEGPKFSVTNSTFHDCLNSIFMTGYQNPIILRNTIVMLPDYANKQSGIALENCTGFRVEENNISGTGNSSGGKVFGIEIDNAGELPNTVYKNNVLETNYALEANGNNRGTTLATGLLYGCNDLTTSVSDAYDMVISPTGTGIAPAQGYFVSGSYLSADNLFNAFSGGISDQNISNGGLDITYYYDVSNPATYPNYVSTNVTKISSTTSGCPTRFASGNPSVVPLTAGDFGLKKASLEYDISVASSGADSVALMMEYRELHDQMIQTYLGLLDSVERSDVDSIVYILDNAMYSHEYKIMAAGYQLQLGQDSAALATLNAISSNYTLTTAEQDWIDDMITAITISINFDETDMDENGVGSVAYDQLLLFSEGSSPYAKSIARYLLSVYFDNSYEPNLIEINGNGSKNSNTNNSVLTGILHEGANTIVPNPVTSEFRIGGLKVGANIEVLDMTGRVLLSKHLNGGADNVNIAGLASGSYVVRLKVEGGNTQNFKLTKH